MVLSGTASIGTLTTSNITHGSELTVTTNLLMGSGSTLTTSNIVGSPSLTVTANTNVVAEFTESSQILQRQRTKVCDDRKFQFWLHGEC
jgi:hypothetical protein